MFTLGIMLESWKRKGELAKLPRVVQERPVDDRQLDVYSRHLGLESCKQWGELAELPSVALARPVNGRQRRRKMAI